MIKVRKNNNNYNFKVIISKVRFLIYKDNGGLQLPHNSIFIDIKFKMIFIEQIPLD